MAGTTVHTLENQQLLEQVERESAAAARQLAETAHLRKGQLVVIGCSTSEVVGHQVGSWSTPEVAVHYLYSMEIVCKEPYFGW